MKTPSYLRVRELMRDTPWTPLGYRLIAWHLTGQVRTAFQRAWDTQEPYGLWRM